MSTVRSVAVRKVNSDPPIPAALEYLERFFTQRGLDKADEFLANTLVTFFLILVDFFFILDFFIP